MSRALDNPFSEPVDIASADAVRDEIVDRLRLHTEMVARLLTEPDYLPHDFAAFLEDVANAYLDIADEVSARFTAPPGLPH